MTHVAHTAQAPRLSALASILMAALPIAALALAGATAIFGVS